MTSLRAWMGIVAAILLLCLSGTVQAQDERAAVRLDGRAVLRLAASGSQSAHDRVRQVEARLQSLLEHPDALAPARVEPAAGAASDRVITVAGVPVVTVTDGDAHDNLSSVPALAVQWAQAIERALNRARERRLGIGGRFGAEVQSSIEAAFARLGESAIRLVPRILAALLVIGLFWAIAALVRRLLRALFRRIISDLTVENLIRQLSYYAVWAIGLVVAADALGFEPETVVTGLGLTGLALGFALKDIISNFVSGLLILWLRPFQLGDQIVVGATEGSVERIRLRATEIRTYDGRVVLVPNAEVFTSRITNNTAAPIRRGTVSLPLGYDADVGRAIETIRKAVPSSDGVLAGRPVTIRLQALGSADMQIDVTFWTDSRRADFSNAQSSVRQAVVEAFRQNGIPLPAPDVRLLVPHEAEAWRNVLDGQVQQRESAP